MSGHQDVHAKAIPQLWDRGIQTAKEIQKRTALATKLLIKVQVSHVTVWNHLTELGYIKKNRAE
ncbi:1963_t:CDS:2, partial [Diversispora eburnea]